MSRRGWGTVATVAAAVLVAVILIGFFLPLPPVTWFLVLVGICLVVVMAASGALT